MRNFKGSPQALKVTEDSRISSGKKASAMAHPPENPTPTFTEEGKWVASCILEFAPDLTPIFDVPMRGLSGNEKGSLEGALSYKENFLICREKKI